MKSGHRDEQSADSRHGIDLMLLEKLEGRLVELLRVVLYFSLSRGDLRLEFLHALCRARRSEGKRQADGLDDQRHQHDREAPIVDPADASSASDCS